MRILFKGEAAEFSAQSTDDGLFVTEEIPFPGSWVSLQAFLEDHNLKTEVTDDQTDFGMNTKLIGTREDLAEALTEYMDEMDIEVLEEVAGEF